MARVFAAPDFLVLVCARRAGASDRFDLLLPGRWDRALAGARCFMP
jgi:hypothetical protein